MDLVLSIILVIGISSIKLMHKDTSIVESSIMEIDGTVNTVMVDEAKLVVGKNLMLRREPRAYHKILDEMGLG